MTARARLAGGGHVGSHGGRGASHGRIAPKLPKVKPYHEGEKAVRILAAILTALVGLAPSLAGATPAARIRLTRR